MDNAKPNKNYTFISAMGALVLLGIVKKVKISYLKTGHSHTFGDGVIGNVGSRIIQGDMPSYESFQASVREALKGQGTLVSSVNRIIGTTDYKVMFEDIRKNPHLIEGTISLTCVCVC